MIEASENIEIVQAAKAGLAAEAKLAEDRKLAEAVANESHRRMMAEQGQRMIESQAANKEARRVAHEQSVITARAAKDEVAKVREIKIKLEKHLLFTREDLRRAREAAFKCVTPSADSYPLPDELAAWKSQRAALEEKVREIQQQLAREESEFATASEQRWQAEDALEVAARAEWKLRSEL